VGRFQPSGQHTSPLIPSYVRDNCKSYHNGNLRATGGWGSGLNLCSLGGISLGGWRFRNFLWGQNSLKSPRGLRNTAEDAEKPPGTRTLPPGL